MTHLSAPGSPLAPALRPGAELPEHPSSHGTSCSAFLVGALGGRARGRGPLITSLQPLDTSSRPPTCSSPSRLHAGGGAPAPRLFPACPGPVDRLPLGIPPPAPPSRGRNHTSPWRPAPGLGVGPPPELVLPWMFSLGPGNRREISLHQGSPNPGPRPGTGPRPVKSRAAQQEVSEQSFICHSPRLRTAPHGSPRLPTAPHGSPRLPIAGITA